MPNKRYLAGCKKGGKHKRSKKEKYNLSVGNWLKGHKSEEFKKNLSKKYQFEKHPLWKGGRTVIKDGYIYVLVRNKKHPMYHKRAKEHRLIAEKHLGKFLNKSETIHHINENKQNNVIENFCLTNKANHNKIHANIRRYKKKLKINKLPLMLYMQIAKKYGKVLIEISKNKNSLVKNNLRKNT